MKRAAGLFAGSLLAATCAFFIACRTARPAGEEAPIAPLTAATPEDALRQLHAIRFPERSLMRVRATSGDRTQSFRAQLLLNGGMLLTAYTQLGTTAMRLYADSNHVVFLNDVEKTWWSGTPEEFARSFGFFGDASPVDMALLILGRPVGAARATANGLERAELGGATITYDPPSFPPKRVTIVRGDQRLDIEHLESAYTTANVEAPEVPGNYRCCFPPRL